MRFTRGNATLLAAVIILIGGGYWLMLDTIFQGNIVAGLLEIINPPDRVCDHERDGTRICRTLSTAVEPQ